MGFAFQPHQVRVVEEKKELDEKVNKLLVFLFTPTFDALDESEKARLRLQHSVMKLYSDILGQRIAAFVPPGTDDCDAT